MQPIDRPPYSWRADPATPAFDDTRPLAVMDGDCALCVRGARLIHRWDRSGEIRIAVARSPLGAALLGHFGMSPDDPESWLYLDGGRAWEGLDGIAKAGARCGGPLGAARILVLAPRPLRRWFYARLARNRVAIFGKGDICAVPDPAFRARILE